MKKNWCCKNIHLPSHVLISLAPSRYHFATPEIRLLMRHTLGYALSGRTIKRLAKSHGRRLKRGRPKTTPRVQKKQLNDLIETTSARLDVFNGNALHFLNHIELEFGLSPASVLGMGNPIRASWKVHDAEMSHLWRLLRFPRL